MNLKKLVANILSKMPNITKWQKDFMINLFWLLFAYRGRHNFENLGRQSDYNESTFRNNYSKSFDFLSFNQELIGQYCSEELVIAFDPSFISKSGKHTPGLGYFWSGCAGLAKKGLEIGGFGAVDILNNTCMHLVCKQTLLNTSSATETVLEIKKPTSGNLLSYYADLIFDLRTDLQKTSNYLAVDAYFSKKPFIDKMIAAKFIVISRFRKDVALRYKHVGLKRKGRGCPKRFDGKVNLWKLRAEHFTPIIEEENWKAYEGIVYANALKRWVKVVVVHYFDENGMIKKVHTFFSTDCKTQGTDIIIYYKGRFQIEFLYRDAKQFVGLEQGQSRKEERIDFHFNAALTTVSLAKALYYFNTNEQERKPFSMSSVKTRYGNDLLINKLFSMFGINPKHEINKERYYKIRDFGAIAA
jgi:hypothetical protein